MKSILKQAVSSFLNKRGYVILRRSIKGVGWDALLQQSLGEINNTPGACVLDIGANRGGFSEMVLKNYLKATVFAFEPMLHLTPTMDSIRKKHANFNWYPIALGEENGEAQFHRHVHDDSSSILTTHPDYSERYPDQCSVAESYTVQVRTLDDWAHDEGLFQKFTHIDLIKIDVQGFEKYVIKGGDNAMFMTKHIVVEAAFYQSYKDGIMCDELCSLLRSKGFELVWAFNVYPASADFFFRRIEH